MNNAEIAVQTRNAVLAGEDVVIDVPKPYFWYGDFEEIDDETQSWPQVMGAFAALYSEDLDRGNNLPTQPDASRANDGSTEVFNNTEALYETIGRNLTAAFTKRSLSEIVDFSGHGNLIRLANEEALTGLPETQYSHTKAADKVTERLTARGIHTLADKGIGAAVLLTERLLADDRLSLTPDEIREIVTQQGYKVLIPMMSSEDSFRKLEGRLGRGFLADPREFVRDVAERRIGYDVVNRQVSNVHMLDAQPKKTGEFGCPILHTKPKNALKPAWKIVVDTMWDTHLAPRITSVSSPAK